MNPTLPEVDIQAKYADDPINARAEYGAEFRDDVGIFVSPEIVDACVAHGCHERMPESGFEYHAFVDPSGGGCDAFTLAVAHKEGECCHIDCIRSVRPPLSPDAVTKEFAEVLK